MRLVHRTDGDETVLATDVETADSFLTQALGLMFRRSIPDDYALAFRFDAAKARDVHMLFVRFPLDVVWAADGVVQRVERLSPWTGFAKDTCDALYELPAGTAEAVDPGDEVRLVE
ncbi:DUF192 domain-containing protein [Halobacteriaceae archaeon GCM10025711]